MRGLLARHIGGMVIADHGPLTLAGARDMASFYGREERYCVERGARAWAKTCGDRAQALLAAEAMARVWRRAAGWTDPDAADS